MLCVMSVNVCVYVCARVFVCVPQHTCESEGTTYQSLLSSSTVQVLGIYHQSSIKKIHHRLVHQISGAFTPSHRTS